LIFGAWLPASPHHGQPAATGSNHEAAALPGSISLVETGVCPMGRMVKPYLDEIRAKSKPKVKQAIDRIWQRIVDEGR